MLRGHENREISRITERGFKMKRVVVPSLIAGWQDELDERFAKVKKISDLFHLDVMDGKFVKDESLTFDFKLPKSKKYSVMVMAGGRRVCVQIRMKRVISLMIMVLNAI